MPNALSYVLVVHIHKHGTVSVLIPYDHGAMYSQLHHTICILYLKTVPRDWSIISRICTLILIGMSLFFNVEFDLVRRIR